MVLGGGKTLVLSLSAAFLLCSCGSSSSDTSTNSPSTTNNPTTITHNGFTYGIVTSPITGKQWLDRNLGAKKVCTKSRGLEALKFDGVEYSTQTEANEAYVKSQKDCFGDLYQWGRLADGHEKINYIDHTQNQSVSYDTNLTIDDNGIIKTTGAESDKFIKSNSSHKYDWTDKDSDGNKRKALWSKTDGTSICPKGFRVPTIDELKAETIAYAGVEDESIGKVKVINRDTAFKNFLKFPVSGFRSSDNASLYKQGYYSLVWSSSPNGSSGRDIYFNVANAGDGWYSSAWGFSVRCIKD